MNLLCDAKVSLMLSYWIVLYRKRTGGPVALTQNTGSELGLALLMVHRTVIHLKPSCKKLVALLDSILWAFSVFSQVCSIVLFVPVFQKFKSHDEAVLLIFLLIFRLPLLGRTHSVAHPYNRNHLIQYKWCKMSSLNNIAKCSLLMNSNNTLFF